MTSTITAEPMPTSLAVLAALHLGVKQYRDHSARYIDAADGSARHEVIVHTGRERRTLRELGHPTLARLLGSERISRQILHRALTRTPGEVTEAAATVAKVGERIDQYLDAVERQTERVVWNQHLNLLNYPCRYSGRDVAPAEVRRERYCPSGCFAARPVVTA
jgi:hypothetical protein